MRKSLLKLISINFLDNGETGLSKNDLVSHTMGVQDTTWPDDVIRKDNGTNPSNSDMLMSPIDQLPNASHQMIMTTLIDSFPFLSLEATSDPCLTDVEWEPMDTTN